MVSRQGKNCIKISSVDIAAKSVLMVPVTPAKFSGLNALSISNHVFHVKNVEVAFCHLHVDMDGGMKTSSSPTQDL
jgi:hypothetical protein